MTGNRNRRTEVGLEWNKPRPDRIDPPSTLLSFLKRHPIGWCMPNVDLDL